MQRVAAAAGCAALALPPHAVLMQLLVLLQLAHRRLQDRRRPHRCWRQTLALPQTVGTPATAAGSCLPTA
jgi:hypothetical protein